MPAIRDADDARIWDTCNRHSDALAARREDYVSAVDDRIRPSNPDGGLSAVFFRAGGWLPATAGMVVASPTAGLSAAPGSHRR